MSISPGYYTANRSGYILSIILYDYNVASIIHYSIIELCIIHGLHGTYNVYTVYIILYILFCTMYIVQFTVVGIPYNILVPSSLTKYD